MAEHREYRRNFTAPFTLAGFGLQLNSIVADDRHYFLKRLSRGDMDDIPVKNRMLSLGEQSAVIGTE